jgi:4-alpha-glucanotransferase
MATGDHGLPNGVSNITLNGANGGRPESVLIRFAVNAPTKFGESVVLCGESRTLGSFALASAVPMSFEHPGVWVAEVAHPREPAVVRYKYAITAANKESATFEPGGARTLNTNISSLVGDYLVRDVIRTTPDSSREIFSTQAFASVIFRRPPAVRKGIKVANAEDGAAVSTAVILGKGGFVIRFSVFAERVRVEDEVCIVGVDDSALAANAGLGKTPVPMHDCDAPEWSVAIAMPPSVHRVAYKFVVRNKSTKEICVEDTLERVLELNNGDRTYFARNIGSAPVVFAACERSVVYPSKWRGAGIAVPVFSLRSKSSCGVGEFKDLSRMVDLCKASGYQMLQLLPINDTTSFLSWRDSYPYSAVSCFALHPQYINIESLGTMPSEMAKEYNAERDRLNALPQVDYERVMKTKMSFIRKMYTFQKVEFLKSLEFQQWFSANQAWLVPYALFRFLMEVNGSSNFDKWGNRRTMTLKEMEHLADPSSFHFDYIGMAYYTQFHLHKQLQAASDYAALNQVVFKGDLPIGVNRYCVDTWVNPHLFRLHMQAGAPPDFFSKNGQNWYFPTYDWEAMSKDNYGWWRARLGHMAKYFDAYRIDHILGFFRIWEIPASFTTGMSGRMFPAYPISRAELETRGLWDIQRFTMPYVRDGLLQGMFHEDWWKIKDRYFEPLWHDRLKFKADFNTERKIEAALALPEGSPEGEIKKNEVMKSNMFTLMNNVCLLEDASQPDMFHPRYMMHDTASYQELPSNEWKAALYDIYQDYFFRRQEELWRKSGLEKLPMMKSASNMLVCGEDLGFTPKSVPSVMKETCILSLKVQRMPEDDTAFGIPSRYPHESVATTSSHDTSTFRGWWEEIPRDHRQRYWSELMKRQGDAPVPCAPDIAEWAINDHLKCPSMWTVFPLQDLLAMDKDLRRAKASDEQINDPSNSTHYWRFRLHISIEEIMAKSDFVHKLSALNKSSGRGQAY